MTFNLLDLVDDSKLATKRENKKKLHALLDKYGSVEEIERSGDLRDGFELDFAKIDGALDEVLEERRMGYREPMSNDSDTLQSNEKQSNALLQDDEDFSLEGLTLSGRQRKAIDKLDMNTQLTVIRALREQQGVEKPKKETSETSSSKLDVLREKVDKANREIKIADNEYAGTKSDTEVENKGIEKTNKNDYTLGTLSSNHEAKGNPAVIGEDNAGGPSYGRYQIATKTGTMAKYINFLSKSSKYSKYSKLLNEAGGEDGALQRTNDFENMWVKLSKNEEFNQSQHDFIIDTHLKPLITAVKEKHILNVEKRHPVVKDVLYSLSVQHYRASLIVNRAIDKLKQTKRDNITDEDIIRELYKQRIEYVASLPESKYKGDRKITAREKHNIITNRYPAELREALRYLNK